MDYGEQICEAASIIAKGVVNDLNLDKTIKATVIKNNDLSNGSLGQTLTGEYLCKYENLEFLAYGSPCSYTVNDVVFVNIPEGNWNSRKSIVGVSSKQTNAVFGGINVIYDNEGRYRAYGTDGKFIGYIGGEIQFDNYERKAW